jgi:hypothetical protein
MDVEGDVTGRTFKTGARDPERFPCPAGVLHGYASDGRVNRYEIHIVRGLENQLYVARLEYDLRLALIFSSPSENAHFLARGDRERKLRRVTHSFLVFGMGDCKNSEATQSVPARL